MISCDRGDLIQYTSSTRLFLGKVVRISGNGYLEIHTYGIEYKFNEATFIECVKVKENFGDISYIELADYKPELMV